MGMNIPNLDDLAEKARRGELDVPVPHKPVRVVLEGVSSVGVAEGKDANGLTFRTLMFGHPSGVQYEVPLSIADAAKVGATLTAKVKNRD